MAGEVKWDDAKLRAGLQVQERQCVKLLAAHWTRAAQKKVSVSAGGNSKRARSIRRSKGRLVGVLKKEYQRDLRKGYSPAVAAANAAKTYEKFRHSLPGEPPRKITGFGQRSIVWKMLDMARPIARAGLFVNAMYMYFLETGFVIRRRGAKNRKGGTRVLPRPWAKKSFTEEMPAFQAIARKLGGTI